MHVRIKIAPCVVQNSGDFVFCDLFHRYKGSEKSAVLSKRERRLRTPPFMQSQIRRGSSGENDAADFVL